MTTVVLFDATTDGLVAEALTKQDQADLAAEELRQEDHPGNVYTDWEEMHEAIQEARSSGDSEAQFVFRPGAPVTIPPGNHDLSNVILDGSDSESGVFRADGATMTVSFDASYLSVPEPKKRKRKRNQPVDGKKRGKRRRDFGSAGKGFNAKGSR